MAEQNRRFYEVAVATTQPEAAASNPQRIFLVDAISEAQAFNHVSAKYVERPVRCDTRRVAELLTSGIKVEVAK